MPGVLTSALTGRRILVYERDRDLLRLMWVLLRRTGARVDALDAVPAALRMLDRGGVDVLVCSWDVAGVRIGAELVRALRGATSGATLAVAVARGEMNRPGERARHAGFDACITAPMEVADLVNLVLHRFGTG